MYDQGWADFSLCYANLLENIFTQRNIVPQHILDLACGTGILAIELVRRGYRVHGIDSSPEMITRAKSKVSGSELATFELGDMTRFRTNRMYDIVVCAFDSINYLINRTDVNSMFECAVDCLNTSGLLIFDSNTRHLYQTYQGESNKRELGGVSFIQSCRFNRKQNIAVTSFEFADGTREIHRQRPYDYKDLGPLLAASGLQVIELFSWFNRSPADADTEKLFFLAQKM